MTLDTLIASDVGDVFLNTDDWTLEELEFLLRSDIFDLE